MDYVKRAGGDVPIIEAAAVGEGGDAADGVISCATKAEAAAEANKLANGDEIVWFESDAAERTTTPAA